MKESQPRLKRFSCREEHTKQGLVVVHISIRAQPTRDPDAEFTLLGWILLEKELMKGNGGK